MNTRTAVILAAGDGKRMKSKKPKVLCNVLFKPMVDWVRDAVKKSSIENTVVVVGSKKEMLLEHLAESCAVREQTERLGTGHAVMQALDFIKESGADDVVILCGDAPFISETVLSESYKLHKKEKNSVTVITANLSDPTGYGRIVRDSDGFVTGIVEQKDATEEQKKICEVNSGAYWFSTKQLAYALEHLSNNNAQNEYYLTDTVGIILSHGDRAGAYIAPDSSVVMGANDRAGLLLLNEEAKKRIIRKHLDAGVEFASTDGVTISPDVEIGADTVILQGTILLGKTVIGEDCKLGPNTYIENSRVGSGTVLNSVQVLDSQIDDNVKIGPFTQIRPNCHIKNGVKIGDFVEVKNSVIGEKTAVAHLTYVGDSDVGARVNFGCGTVTVNYDGKDKHRTVIDDYAFIGCNTNLIAPVHVGKNAFTAAGSTITRDVPDDSLVVSRAREQKCIDDWVTKKLGKRRY